MIFSDQTKIGEALKLFYGSQHLGVESFEQPVVYASFGPIKIPFPNFKKRREIVHLHDVNHVLSGYDTSWVGEGEVAAWELATGFPRHCWIGYFYAPFTLVIGFILNPAKVIRAFRRGRGERNACYAQLSKEELFNTSIGDLKTLLNH